MVLTVCSIVGKTKNERVTTMQVNGTEVLFTEMLLLAKEADACKEDLRILRALGEKRVLKHKKLAEWFCWYAKYVIKGRWVEAEEAIAKGAFRSYRYARDVIKGPWPEGETVIAKDAFWSYLYAKDVIKGRWLGGEEAIAKDAFWSYQYARYVIKGRWFGGEETIAKDTECAYLYAKDVIKGRWPDNK